MTDSFDLSGLGMIANFAFAVFKPVFGARRRRYLIPLTHGMTCGINISVQILIVAIQTGMGRVTLFCAGGFSHNGYVGMPCCINNFLHHKNVSANSTMISLRKTVLGAGRLYPCVDHHSMPESCNQFSITNGTGLGSCTRCL